MTKRVALALSGGGALGAGHVPVLEALDDLGIRPIAIAGTSMGAMLGAAYAAGMSAAEIRAEITAVLEHPFDTLRRVSGSLTPPGWNRPMALAPDVVVDKLMPDLVPKTFEGLPIPLTVVATDYFARSAVTFASGDLRPALAASIAIPMIFRPQRRHGRVLVDGGLTNNLPFDLLPDADIVLAVDVTAAPVEDRSEPPRMMEAGIGSIRVMMTAMLEAKLQHVRPDILIRPRSRYLPMEFVKMREIMDAAAPSRLETHQRLAELLAG